MAGSSKKGSTKSPKSPESPKRVQKGRAATAPKTKAAAVPETKAATAQSKSVDVNNEDYNIRSPERTQLLTQIKANLNNTPVSPTFWACCQLADMNRLRVVTETDGKMIRFSVRQLCALPLQWNQRLRDSAFPGSQAAFKDSAFPESEAGSRPKGSKRRKLDSDAQSLVPRSAKEADNCKERDGHKCVLTKIPGPQAAHIFPHCMLQPRPKFDRNKMSSSIADFWECLYIFWDEGQVNKWKNTIFPDGVGVESCFNLISLSSIAHEMWNKGLFALKPLKLSRDRKTLTVQFFWQVPGNYEIDSKIDLLTETPSSEGLDAVGEDAIGHGYYLTRPENDRSTPRICSGDTFTFTTKDPENLPLPSMELLEMQWVLQRLVGMSGAAGWPSLDTIDDDSVDDDNCLIQDYTDYSAHKTSKRVRDWAECVFYLKDRAVR